MNFGANTQLIDTYINSSLYGGTVTQGEGIDLRLEMNWLLYGKNIPPYRKPKGHWVVYRRFDRCTVSENYQSSTKESVGGPGFAYTDELLKTRRVPTDAKGIPLDATKAGIGIGDKYLYYFEYTLKPKRGDQIFEIDWDDHSVAPTQIESLTYLDRYSVARIHAYRLEDGNIQYYIVSTEFDEVSY